jgi:hypothetical protein
MARYNEILVGRYGRFAQRLFGTKGGVPVAQLSSDVQIAISLFSGAEHRNLESWQKFAVGALIGAQGVGNANSVRLINPAASNIIVVVERFMVYEAANDTLTFDYSRSPAAALANPNSAQGLDNRGPANGVATVSNGVGVAIGGLMASLSLVANTMAELITTDIQEFVLAPGSAVQVRTAALNAALGFTLMWRERFLDEAERFV